MNTKKLLLTLSLLASSGLSFATKRYNLRPRKRKEREEQFHQYNLRSSKEKSCVHNAQPTASKQRKTENHKNPVGPHAYLQPLTWDVISSHFTANNNENEHHNGCSDLELVKENLEGKYQSDLTLLEIINSEVLKEQLQKIQQRQAQLEQERQQALAYEQKIKQPGTLF